MSCHKLLEEKATALEHCPMEVLVVDFTPCDTAWRAQRHLHASSPGSAHGSAEQVAQQAAHALKLDVRQVFAPELPERVGSADKTPAWALTIHGSVNAQETEGLRAVLSNFSRGSRVDASAERLSTPSTNASKFHGLYCRKSERGPKL